MSARDFPDAAGEAASGVSARHRRAGRAGAVSPGRRGRVLALALLAALAATPALPSAATAAGPAAAMPLAPEFALPGRGGELRLADYRGEVVYVDFWASWCPPCLRSFPWMSTLAERYRERGLRVVAISVDSEREAAERFLERAPARFDVAFDTEGAVAEAFGLRGMPSSYLVDREGRLVFAHVGFRDRDRPAIEAAIERVLGKGAR